MSQPRDIFPFKDVTVSVAPDKSKIIQWNIDHRFRFDNDVVGFHVDISRGGEWFRLTETPVVDMCLYVDQDRYRCGLRNDIFYRVVAVDTLDVEYKSKPVNIFHCWKDSAQWRIARDILRKEYLRLQKLPTGTEGYLLKARQHGPKCTECLDHDLQESIVECCGNCFGTGFKGGYYDAIPFWLDLSGTSSQENKTSTFGVVNNKKRIARAVAYPLVSEYDIWVATKTNQRFIINKVESTGETLIIPLIYRLTISELVQSDEAYNIPAHQDMEDIHGDAAADLADDYLDEDITQKEVW